MIRNWQEPEITVVGAEIAVHRNRGLVRARQVDVFVASVETRPYAGFV